MVTVFWHYQGVILLEFLEGDTTINVDRYAETLDKLRAAIKRRKPGHSAARQCTPAYSPYLAL